MQLDTLYLLSLVGGMLLAFMAAVAAVLAGLWFAGRLTGVMGRPSQVTDSQGFAASGLVDSEGGDPDPLEGVPWLDSNGQPGTEAPSDDPGDDPEAWEQAPE